MRPLYTKNNLALFAKHSPHFKCDLMMVHKGTGGIGVRNFALSPNLGGSEPGHF